MAGKAKGNKPKQTEETVKIPLTFDKAVEGLLSVKPKKKTGKKIQGDKK